MNAIRYVIFRRDARQALSSEYLLPIETLEGFIGRVRTELGADPDSTNIYAIRGIEETEGPKEIS